MTKSRSVAQVDPAEWYRRNAMFNREHTCGRPFTDPEHDLTQYDIVTSFQTRLEVDAAKEHCQK